MGAETCFEGMIVIKNRNRSGSVSVQIISKSDSSYRVVQTACCAREPDEIAQLFKQAKNIIAQNKSQLSLLPVKSQDEVAIEAFKKNISNVQIRVVGCLQLKIIRSDS